jgi:hypothetical protein
LAIARVDIEEETAIDKGKAPEAQVKSVHIEEELILNA